MSQLTLNNSRNSVWFTQTRLLIASCDSWKNDEVCDFSTNWNYVSLTCLVYYTCSSKSAIRVEDCFELKRQRYDEQNFALNAIWMIISTTMSFHLKWWFVNDTKTHLSRANGYVNNSNWIWEYWVLVIGGSLQLTLSVFQIEISADQIRCDSTSSVLTFIARPQFTLSDERHKTIFSSSNRELRAAKVKLPNESNSAACSVKLISTGPRD